MTKREFTLADLQDLQGRWQEYNFGSQPSYRLLLGLTEEIGELSHSHLKSEQGIRRNEDHLSKAQDAVGDIVIYLAGYCNARHAESPGDGWDDLHGIVERTWNQVCKRNWVEKPDTAHEGLGDT